MSSQRIITWFVMVVAALLMVGSIGWWWRLHNPVCEAPVCPVMTMSFDESMEINNHTVALSQQSSKELFNLFKRLYERNRLDKVQPAKQVKIPRIIHVIWLGGKLPSDYEGFYTSWVTHHPDWVHLFWTDSKENYVRGAQVLHSFDEVASALKNPKDEKRFVVDIADLQFANRPFYDKSINYGERSDILKWEVVYRFGGVYVDTDFECLRSLDYLHHIYDFYTGLQPLDTSFVQLGAALYGAIPGHPIMRACVEGIKENQHIVPVIAKTGPLHFTRSFIANAHKGNLVNIAFPASYFYPCSYEQRVLAKEVWHKDEAFAVHHWAGSWLKPEGFVKA